MIPILLEELHLTFRAPARGSEAIYTTAARTLRTRTFLSRVRRAVQAVIALHPELAGIRFRVER